MNECKTSTEIIIWWFDPKLICMEATLPSNPLPFLPPCAVRVIIIMCSWSYVHVSMKVILAYRLLPVCHRAFFALHMQWGYPWSPHGVSLPGVSHGVTPISTTQRQDRVSVCTWRDTCLWGIQHTCRHSVNHGARMKDKQCHSFRAVFTLVL